MDDDYFWLKVTSINSLRTKIIKAMDKKYAVTPHIKQPHDHCTIHTIITILEYQVANTQGGSIKNIILENESYNCQVWFKT